MTSREEKNLEYIVRRMQQDASEDAPPDARQFVKNLFKTRVVVPKVSPIGRLVAAITMELSPDQAAFGERSGSASASRQILFSAGEAAIDLRIDAAGKNFDIRGQFLGPDFDKATATLSGGDVSLRSLLDEIGGFRFNGVKSGVYDLTLRSASEEILIEGLRLE